MNARTLGLRTVDDVVAELQNLTAPGPSSAEWFSWSICRFPAFSRAARFGDFRLPIFGPPHAPGARRPAAVRDIDPFPGLRAFDAWAVDASDLLAAHARFVLDFWADRYNWRCPAWSVARLLASSDSTDRGAIFKVMTHHRSF